MPNASAVTRATTARNSDMTTVSDMVASTFCPSTVSRRMLAAIEGHVVLSEPESIATLLHPSPGGDGASDEGKVALLRALIGVLGQPRFEGERRSFVKFDPWQIHQFDSFQIEEQGRIGQRRHNLVRLFRVKFSPLNPHKKKVYQVDFRVDPTAPEGIRDIEGYSYSK